jgi:hypothetical protein
MTGSEIGTDGHATKVPPPLVKGLGLLLISVNVVASVLCQVVELLGVLIHRMVPLEQIEELKKLAGHGAY